MAQERKGVHDIKNIINSWADKVAQENKTKCEWVDFSCTKKNYKEKFSGCGFNKVGIVNHKLIRNNNPIEIESERKIIKRWVRSTENNSSTTDEYNLDLSDSITKTHSCSLSFGIDLGIDLTIPFPFIEAGISCAFNLSLTKEQATESSSSINESMHFTMNPMCKYEVEAEESLIPCIDRFTLEIDLVGKIPIRFKDKVKYISPGSFIKSSDGAKIQFISLTDIIRGLEAKHMLPNNLKYMISGDTVRYCLEGEYKFHRHSVAKRKKEIPLTTNTETVSTNPASPATIDNTRLNSALTQNQNLFFGKNQPIKVNDEKSVQKLIEAIEANEPNNILHALSHVGVNIPCSSRLYNPTPLLIAAEMGNFEALECLIKAGADVNAKNGNGDTALHLAANNPNIIKALISNGAQRQSNNAGKMPEFFADNEEARSLITKRV